MTAALYASLIFNSKSTYIIARQYSNINKYSKYAL